jgi:hypothetical protein
MPDERQDSIRQGIAAPEESPTGMAAEEERRKRAAEGPRIGGAMGGTSDAERAGDEAAMNAAMRQAEDEAAREGEGPREEGR